MKRIAAALAFLALAAPALAQAPPSPPSLLAVKAIQQEQKAPKFSRNNLQLDVFRAQIAAGVKLDAGTQADMGELAFSRKLPIEAENMLKPLFDAGVLGGPSDRVRERNLRVYAAVKQDAEDARSFRLMANENTAGMKDTGALYLETGENYLGDGDNAKAAKLIQEGLTRGRLTPEEEALGKLHLGIAQYREGKRDAARATWATIKSDTGVEQLAQAWTIISQER